MESNTTHEQRIPILVGPPSCIGQCTANFCNLLNRTHTAVTSVQKLYWQTVFQYRVFISDHSNYSFYVYAQIRHLPGSLNLGAGQLPLSLCECRNCLSGTTHSHAFSNQEPPVCYDDVSLVQELQNTTVLGICLSLALPPKAWDMNVTTPCGQITSRNLTVL